MRIVEKVFSTVYNQLTPEQQRAITKALKSGNRAAIKSVASIFNIPISEAKKMIEADKASVSKEATIRPASNFDIFKADVQSYFRTLGSNSVQGEKARQDALMNIIATFIPVSRSGAIASKALSIFKSSGANKAINFVIAEAQAARNSLVKTNPKAAEQIAQKASTLKTNINNKIFDIKSGTKTVRLDKMTDQEIAKFFNDEVNTVSLKEAENLGVIKGGSSEMNKAFATLFKDSAKGVKQIADELGVKSKAEIPNVINFIKELGKVIQNSPVYIKSKALNQSIPGIITNAGLSIYDMYQAYKENGNSLLPKTIANVGRTGGSLIPGNFGLKMLYGTLGYVAGDKLAKAGLRNLGAKEETNSIIENEIKQGIYQPGLDEEVPEFIEGMSGRKYHVTGNKIFDFATGRPVVIADALKDANELDLYKTNQVNDQIATASQTLNDLIDARNSGYNISDDQIITAQTNLEGLRAQKAELEKNRIVFSQDYDPNSDLVEQYKQRTVIPVEQQQQAQQMQYQANFTNLYKQAFERIAQDTYDDLDNFYTPENQAVDYYQYSIQAMQNKVPHMTPEEFTRYQKAQAMHQLAPKIQQNALQYAQSTANQMYQQGTLGLNLAKLIQYQQQFEQVNQLNQAKFEEEKRQNQVENQQKLMNYLNEVDRTKIQATNAAINQQKADIAAQGNVLRQQEIDVKKQIQPYQQMYYMGSGLSGAAMGGLTPDQYINANPEVAKQVFPAAFNNENNQTQQQTQQNQPNLIQRTFSLFRQGQ